MDRIVMPPLALVDKAVADLFLRKHVPFGLWETI